MGDTVFYMRSSSPSGIMQPLNDQIIEDLRAFADVSEDEFLKVVEAIGQAEPFLDRQGLREVVQSTVSGDVDAAVVGRVIRSLHRMETEGAGAEELIQRLPFVERTDDPGEQAVSEEQVALIQSRLEKLKASWHSLERQKKAESLGKATGQRLQNVQLICDLRPVFDTERERIEGWIPLTTMHIAMEGADGLPNGLDVVLSASDVDKLVDLASAAQRKLKLLRDSVEELDSKIPATEITTISDE